MSSPTPQPVSGHIYVKERVSGKRWYVRWRDANGEHRKLLGRTWEGHGTPPPGYLRRREANAELQRILVAAREQRASQAKVATTFADAAREWLRHGEDERSLKPSTLIDYRSVLNARLLPSFGKHRLDKISAGTIERTRAKWLADGMSHRNANKQLAILHGIFERARKVYGLSSNPAAEVEKLKERYDSTRFDFYTPDEVAALVRHAASEQDAAFFLTAAFTGLRRGELVALRWRDVDFQGSALRVWGSYAKGALTAPKSGKARVIPMVSDVANALARLSQRENSTGDDDLVFVGELGSYLDASALRRRYVAAQDAAGLRQLRFHDLRHTFGSLAINRASIVQVQNWMGHADVDTTSRYLHHKSREEDAAILAQALHLGPSDASQNTPKTEHAQAVPNQTGHSPTTKQYQRSS
jgi:integrase